jgi:hypothetical protein
MIQAARRCPKPTSRPTDRLRSLAAHPARLAPLLPPTTKLGNHAPAKASSSTNLPKKDYRFYALRDIRASEEVTIDHRYAVDHDGDQLKPLPPTLQQPGKLAISTNDEALAHRALADAANFKLARQRLCHAPRRRESPIPGTPRAL